MRRSSIFFEFLKILLLALILIILGMVYWSTNLIEDQVISLKKSIDQIEVRGPEVQETTQSQPPQNLGKSDPSLPNLFENDPFREKTLPELLGKNFRRYPIRLDASYIKPESLAPLSNWAQVSDWLASCTGTAGTTLFGKYNTLAPYLAWKMEERNREDGKGVEYWLHLRDDIFWEPLPTNQLPNGITLAPHFLERRPVTAEDFKFAFDIQMNPFNQETKALSIQGLYSDVESFEVKDPKTFVVRWKVKPFTNEKGETVYKPRYIAKLLTAGLSPLAEWVWAYQPDGKRVIALGEERKSVSIIQHMQLHWGKNIIPSCGPWVFEEMTDEAIRFKRNTRFFQPLLALYNDWEVSFRASADSIWNDFKIGKFSTYSLNPQQIPEWERFKNSPEYAVQKARGEEIHSLTYTQLGYYYIGWNMARPLFRSKKVRQAMTLAIDRKRIINEVLYGQAIEITGPFPQDSPSTNPNLKPWPYDPDLARKILKEEGWSDLNGDGILEKEIDGKIVPFTFKIIFAGKGPATRAMVDAVTTQLKKIGVVAEPLGLELADLSSRFERKDFDAISLGWGASTPPEDPRQLWSSKGANEIGSSNMVGFANKETDEIIDALDYEDNKEKRLKLYHRFCEIIYDEQPYTFLYSSKVNLLYRDWMGNVFIPKDRQDLVPGADVNEPESSIFFDRRAFRQ